MSRRPRWIMLAAFFAAGGARAEAVSEAPDTVALTLYQDERILSRDLPDHLAYGGGLAMVTETRAVTVGEGETLLRFKGVADGMVPQSVRIEGLPKAGGERIYDFDLLSPGAVMQRSVGQKVQVTRTNRATGAVERQTAVIRAAPQGLVIQTKSGVEALNCGGEAERLIFGDIPPELSDRPTLSARTAALPAGRYTVTLTYLAAGIGWAADYVARVEPDGRHLRLTGWLTLANGGGTSFRDAQVKAVAGELSRDEDGSGAPEARLPHVTLSCWPTDTTTRVSGSVVPAPMAAPPAPAPTVGLEEVIVTARRRQESWQAALVAVAAAEELADYKAFAPPFATTVAARQTKQVAFLDVGSAPFQPRFRIFAGEDEGVESARAFLRLDNTRRGGLGRSLPDGAVSVREQTVAGPEGVIGEGVVVAAIVGQPLEIPLNEASLVTGASRILKAWSEERGGLSFQIERREVVLVNDRKEPAVIEVLHSAEATEVVRESVRHDRLFGSHRWVLTVPPGSARRLTYTIRRTD